MGDNVYSAEPEYKAFVVDDAKDVPVGGTIPIIASFDTVKEASEFIGTLPEYLTGRYGITGPSDDVREGDK